MADLYYSLSDIDNWDTAIKIYFARSCVAPPVGLSLCMKSFDLITWKSCCPPFLINFYFYKYELWYEFRTIAIGLLSLSFMLIQNWEAAASCCRTFDISGSFQFESCC